MTNRDVQVIHSIPGGLLEGPRWHPSLGLIYADAAHGGVYSLRESTGEPSVVIPFRKGIGGLVLHVDGGAVVTGRNVAFKRFSVGEDASASPTVVLLDQDPSAGRVGFNDLTTDSAGRIFVGSLGFVAMHEAIDGHAAGPPGSLYMIDTDGSATVLADDIQLSNGMAFSKEDRRLYQCDSGRGLVFAYDFDEDSRSVKQRSTFFDLDGGVPDGIAVSVDGTVWVAVAHAGRVVAISPEGQQVDEIQFPVPMVTSLCFGGPDLRTMYVVSGSEGSDPEIGACIFTLDVGVAGVPIVDARTPIGSQ